jgi:hypothetical protein
MDSLRAAIWLPVGKVPVVARAAAMASLRSAGQHGRNLTNVWDSGRSYFVRPEPLLAKDVFTAMHQRLEQPLLLDEERPICGPFERPSPFTNIARTKPTGV